VDDFYVDAEAGAVVDGFRPVAGVGPRLGHSRGCGRDLGEQVNAAGHLEKQHSWRPALAQALADRAGAEGPPTLAQSARAGAALNCLNVALDHWTASDGRLNLIDLLDEAFAALG
jgi:hypothetical protein